MEDREDIREVFGNQCRRLQYTVALHECSSYFDLIYKHKSDKNVKYLKLSDYFVTCFSFPPYHMRVSMESFYCYGFEVKAITMFSFSNQIYPKRFDILTPQNGFPKYVTVLMTASRFRNARLFDRPKMVQFFSKSCNIQTTAVNFNAMSDIRHSRVFLCDTNCISHDSWYIFSVVTDTWIKWLVFVVFFNSYHARDNKYEARMKFCCLLAAYLRVCSESVQQFLL